MAKFGSQWMTELATEEKMIFLQKFDWNDVTTD